MGNSDLAVNLAHRLDPVHLPAVAAPDALDNLRELMANESGPVKVVFIDSRVDPLDFEVTPDEIITILIKAAEIFMEKCKGHNHANAHCELVHFHPMSTPANYVTEGEPADLDPSENKTSWFNLLNSKTLPK